MLDAKDYNQGFLWIFMDIKNVVWTEKSIPLVIHVFAASTFCETIINPK
jgi:hypothetical protein